MKLTVVLVAILALLVAVPAMANTYNIVFTDSPNPGGAIVGSGTFDFMNSVGDGSYYINTLGGFTINFTVGSSTFTDADIDTDLSHVLVTVYGAGSLFYFDNDGTYGPHGGSLDFDQATGPYLTTEPNYYGAPPLDLYQVLDSNGNQYFGMYGVPTPEPASLLLLGAGLFGLAGLKLKR